MQKIKAFLAATLLAVPHQGLRQVASVPDNQKITGSEIRHCNRATATPIGYARVLTHYKALRGSCVAIVGYWRSRALFKAVHDGDVFGSNDTRKLRGKRIGLYVSDQLLDSAPASPTRYLIIGVVSDCETEWSGELFITGYCHYTDGPILFVAQAIMQ